MVRAVQRGRFGRFGQAAGLPHEVVKLGQFPFAPSWLHPRGRDDRLDKPGGHVVDET